MRMQRHQGFTLIEMMVVVMIMAVVLAILVPKIGQMRADNRTLALSNELGAALRNARTASLVRHRKLTFASLDAGTSTNLWGKQGWMLSDVPSGEIVFKRTNIPGSVTINSTSTDSSLVFDGLAGRVTKADGTPLNMTFVVCDSQVGTELGHTVTLGVFGAVAVTRNTSLTTCNP